MIARFEAERQALAMMDHSNIAKILDAGATDDGSPYFVMELVDGVPLTRYCDDNKLSIEQRLMLFVPVCKAIQHAHQKGIIHRDVKPSNVLVTLQDGDAVPKVIDFGLAKALQHTTRLTEKTMFTEFGKIIGTLQYMSPEQADINAQDIDTRTDIYSLGVMLYELLTGSTPLEREFLGGNGLMKVLEIIREKEPPRPSTRLGNSSNQIKGIGEQRKIAPSKLQQILLGELDWIVMKALEKERNRRYETANSFADDICRFLEQEAVLAKPPSTGYKLQKFVRKNRGLVASIATIVVLLMAGIGGTTWFAWGEINQRKLAEANAEEATESAKRSSDALKIFGDSFRSVDPNEGANAQMSAKDVLMRVKANLEQSELDDMGRAELLSVLSTSFFGVGEYQLASETANEDVRIRERNWPGHPTIIRSRSALAASYLRLGRINESLEIFHDVVVLSEKEFGPDHEETLTHLKNLALNYRQVGKIYKSLEIYEEAARKSKNKLGMQHIDTLVILTELAANLRQIGRTNEAVDLDEDVLKRKQELLGIDHPQTLTSMINLANDYSELSRFQDAAKLEEQALILCRAKLGNDHATTLTCMSNLAYSYRDTGLNAEALKLDEETFERRRAKLGLHHPETIMSMGNLATSYRQDGQEDIALELFQRAFELAQEKLTKRHPITLTTMHNLALSYEETGYEDVAQRLFVELFDLRTEVLGPDHPSTFNSLQHLGNSYWKTESYEKAIPIFADLVKKLESKLGRTHSQTQTAISVLARSKAKLGRTTEAIELMEEVFESSNQIPNLASIWKPLADAYLKSDRHQRFQELLSKQIEKIRDGFHPMSRELAAGMLEVGQKYQEAKSHLLATEVLTEAVAIYEELKTKDEQAITAELDLASSLIELAIQKTDQEQRSLLQRAELHLLKLNELINDLVDSQQENYSLAMLVILDELIRIYKLLDKPGLHQKYLERRNMIDDSSS